MLVYTLVYTLDFEQQITFKNDFANQNRISKKIHKYERLLCLDTFSRFVFTLSDVQLEEGFASEAHPKTMKTGRRYVFC